MCTASLAAILLLLAGNAYLYNCYFNQKTLIEKQAIEIKQLQEELENSESGDGYFQKLFGRSWPNFKMPLFDSDDIVDRKTSRSHYSSITSSKTEKEYMISTILPGYSKEDVSIELQDNILKIHAKNNSLDSTKEYDQSIQIPNDTDIENIDITLSDGILKITIPRSTREQKNETKKLIIK
jgi:HSP20 family protein